jgi:hypothetical protein
VALVAGLRSADHGAGLRPVSSSGLREPPAFPGDATALLRATTRDQVYEGIVSYATEADWRRPGTR